MNLTVELADRYVVELKRRAAEDGTNLNQILGRAVSRYLYGFDEVATLTTFVEPPEVVDPRLAESERANPTEREV